MINIVGIACNAQIGDYPDPMTFRINHIYPGCYISMSDIMMAYLQSGGKNLTPPGFDLDITTVAPIFNDNRIQEES